MELDVNPCTWLSLFALQSEVRPVSVTPGKSLHPALTAGFLPHSRVTSAIIKVHKYTYMHTHICAKLSNRHEFWANGCMISTHIHIFSINYPHIDGTRGRDTALYTLVLAVISLQNINGHCRGHLKYITAHYCLQTPDPHTHFSVPITLYCCCCLWMVLHHSCLIFPSCHSGSADDTDAKLNGRLRAAVEGSGMWKEMQVISNRIKPACHLLCIKMSISGPVFIFERNLSAEWK